MVRNYQPLYPKSAYPVFVEIGIILSLLFVIILSRIQFPVFSEEPVFHPEIEEITSLIPAQFNEVIVSEVPEKPTVPVHIPDDTPIHPSPLFISEYKRVPKIIVPATFTAIKNEVDSNTLESLFIPPKPIGGEQALRDAIDYPVSARRKQIQGLVIVAFTVTKSGKVENPRIIKGIGDDCNNSVLKAIKLIRYEPGTKNGIPINTLHSEKVQFILIDKSY